MRFINCLVLALPALVRSDGLFEQYKSQFQNALGLDLEVPVEDAGPIKTLTLNTWKDTLYSRAVDEAPESDKSMAQVAPTKWWILVSGRNKTCHGLCSGLESAFAETEAKLVESGEAPNMAVLNCDDQPLLCNSWATGPADLWLFELLPRPAPAVIYTAQLNKTATNSDTIAALIRQGSSGETSLERYDGYFHPLDGPLAKYGLALPIGLILSAVNAVPGWLLMFILSFGSRMFISRRLAPPVQRPPPTAAPVKRRGAPPGDGLS